MVQICLMFQIFRSLDTKLKSLTVSLESNFTFHIHRGDSLGCSSARICFSTLKQLQMPGMGGSEIFLERKVKKSIYSLDFCSVVIPCAFSKENHK